MDPLSIIASTIAIFGAISKTYDTIKKISGLPEAFEEVKRQVPIVNQILRGATLQLAQGLELNDEETASVLAIVNPCKEKAEKLENIFKKLQDKCQAEGGPLLWKDRIRNTYHSVLAGTKANKVERLMEDILKGAKLLALNQVFKTGQDLTAIEKAIESLAIVEPSIPDSELEGAGIINAQQSVASNAHGQQNNVQGGSNTFNTGQYIGQNLYFGERPKQ
ncbi:hypothetical protein TWF694_001939 [Orbilia ellipsospora]|uniref:NACHT-NTPase and P-loop NTPases N-terminal domain-containing protein n=1 Tax=Orbilia ellipsospora TaxID=2528407 RepID=A0AAV9X5I0_9PEZI